MKITWCSWYYSLAWKHNFISNVELLNHEWGCTRSIAGICICIHLSSYLSTDRKQPLHRLPLQIHTRPDLTPLALALTTRFSSRSRKTIVLVSDHQTAARVPHAIPHKLQQVLCGPRIMWSWPYVVIFRWA